MAINQKKRILLSSMLTVLGFFAIVTSSLAWFSTLFTFKSGITGSSISNYYAGGDGTLNNPFLIAEPRHLYNFTWLQNNGFYPNTTYFKLSNNIDMKGALPGLLSNETGAIPPIGTDQYPFYGNFDGNGKTIKNLWVSSDYNDWKEKPLGAAQIDIGKSIGFFGNIGQVKTPLKVGTIRHFYLENLQVTTKVNSSKVGLVVGYANGNVQAIGVKNGKISIPSTITVLSDTTLIGQIGNDVSWEDSPDQQTAGNLVIDPNATTFNTITNGNQQMVPGSVPNTAYFVGTLNNISYNAGNTLYKYINPITATENLDQAFDATNATGASTVTIVTSANRATLVSPEFWARFQAGGNSLISIPKTAPTVVTSGSPAVTSFTNPYTLTLANATQLSVPRNSIWFKPLKGGKSGISFVRQNQAATIDNISVYQFKRTTSGISNFRQIKFGINKSLGNKSVVYFDFIIPQSMVTANYEFLISASTEYPAPDSTGFFYLSLTGTDESSGGKSAEINAVDYVFYQPNGLFEDLTLSTYKPKNVLLKFNGTYTGNAYYNMRSYANINGLVYFAKDGTLVITNPLTNTVGTSVSWSENEFPPRQTTL